MGYKNTVSSLPRYLLCKDLVRSELQLVPAETCASVLVTLALFNYSEYERKEMEL